MTLQPWLIMSATSFICLFWSPPASWMTISSLGFFRAAFMASLIWMKKTLVRSGAETPILIGLPAAAAVVGAAAEVWAAAVAAAALVVAAVVAGAAPQPVRMEMAMATRTRVATSFFIFLLLDCYKFGRRFLYVVIQFDDISAFYSRFHRLSIALQPSFMPKIVRQSCTISP
ncbi:hypothetical protein SDC9_204316 [bioreactor metagenome]|uniref:Uncharacterized protein n=1 Tax=bioreactor metagenome TaxID=1076179 RepID=A0A645IZJ1_9ZZZZ